MVLLDTLDPDISVLLDELDQNAMIILIPFDPVTKVPLTVSIDVFDLVTMLYH